MRTRLRSGELRRGKPLWNPAQWRGLLRKIPLGRLRFIECGMLEIYDSVTGFQGSRFRVQRFSIEHYASRWLAYDEPSQV